MRFIFGPDHVRHFVRIVQSFSRITDEVRLVSSSDSIRIEAVKDPVAFGTITVTGPFFDFFAEEEPIDVIFKSRSIQLIFRNANLLAKKLIRFDVTIQPDEDCAVFRQTMKNYDRVSHIPFQNRQIVSELNFGDYKSNPVQLTCPVKLLVDGMRHFPCSIELVTMRIRGRNVKCETGDEEAEYMTKFNFHVAEFETYKQNEEVTVTFSLKLLKQFLSAWDKKTQNIDAFFKEGCGIVFVTVCTGFKTRLMVATVNKDHPPNSPVPTGDETITSTILTDTTAANQSLANMSISNANLPHVSADESAISGNLSAGVDQSPALVDDDDEQFDDSLDAICASVQVTTASTSRQNGHIFDGATQPAANESPGNESTPESYDHQIYAAVLQQTLIARARKIGGLDETVHTVSRYRLDDDSDDDSVGDLIFND